MKRKSNAKQARPVWSGMLQFDLVSIPVKAYSAKRKSEEISLDWLQK